MGAIIAILDSFISNCWAPRQDKAIFVAATSELAWSIYEILMQLLPWTSLLPQPMIEGSELPQSKLRSDYYPLIVATPNLIADAIFHGEVQVGYGGYVLFDGADLMVAGEQFRRFCWDIKSHGAQIITGQEEIPQEIRKLCLRGRPCVETKAITM